MIKAKRQAERQAKTQAKRQAKRQAKSKLKAIEEPELWACRQGTGAPRMPKGKRGGHSRNRPPETKSRHPSEYKRSKNPLGKA